MKLYAVVILLLANVPSSCTQYVTFSPRCTPATSGYFGQVRVPRGQVDLFDRSVSVAVEVVNSVEFERRFEAYVVRYSKVGESSRAWDGVDAVATIAALRRELKNLNIATYGGAVGFLKHRFSGNLAYDGSENGLIRINRWGLPRSSASVANTIAHEAAHAVDLTHPHSASRFDVALCEPPYVIGAIVERIADRRVDRAKMGPVCPFVDRLDTED